MTPHSQSVRAYLAALETRGWLRAVTAPVEPRFEISAHFCHAGDGPALRFDRVSGHAMGVFGNLLCSLSELLDRDNVPSGQVRKLTRRIFDIVDDLKAEL